ncbi:MAG: DUF4159 domain-containing protein [Vicinamibacterales bacterium]
MAAIIGTTSVMVVALGAEALAKAAQGGRGFGGGRRPPLVERDRVPYDGRFMFARLRYGTSMGRREPPWSHDYPRADWHFMRIVEEITLTRTHREESNVFSLDDPELMNHPVSYMSEPGYWSMTDEEADGLRAYLLKGGFVIFDDFRGADWDHLEAQMSRVLPDLHFLPMDVTSPVFHSFFEIKTLEFQAYYDRDPSFWGLFEGNDPSKRLIAVANRNNDIGEYWEFSDTGYVPIDLSNEAYKFGVNYLVYAMTH